MEMRRIRGSILAQRSARGKLEVEHVGRGSETVAVRWLTLLFSFAMVSIAAAQGFPERPVRIVVPLTPGGSPDTLARVLAQGLQAVWAQPVVVENRPGGNQNIGADVVAKSAPDGHTWLLAPDNVFSVNPHLAKPPFDPLADFTPVTMVARVPFLLVVNPGVPAASVQELIAYAKSRPGELNYGSSGNGSPQHLGAVLLQQLAGVRMNHVPYKGAAPAIADLLPGRIQVWIGAPNSLLPHIRDGRLRALASTASRRNPNLGDLPTVAEAGVPGYELDPWLGLFLPARVPAETVDRIHAQTTRILDAPETKAKLAAQGIDIATSLPSEFARFVREDNARWGRIIRETGIRGE
jgi:tripartite-type tricarboxylate transporter receptor subunit TctC